MFNLNFTIYHLHKIFYALLKSFTYNNALSLALIKAVMDINKT